jgi:hypothetical protein
MTRRSNRDCHQFYKFQQNEQPCEKRLNKKYFPKTTRFHVGASQDKYVQKLARSFDFSDYIDRI